MPGCIGNLVVGFVLIFFSVVPFDGLKLVVCAKGRVTDGSETGRQMHGSQLQTSGETITIKNTATWRNHDGFEPRFHKGTVSHCSHRFGKGDMPQVWALREHEGWHAGQPFRKYNRLQVWAISAHISAESIRIDIREVDFSNLGVLESLFPN